MTFSCINLLGVGKFKGKPQEIIKPHVFCKGEHFNDSCDQYVDVTDRRKQLQRQGVMLFALELGTCPNNVQVFL